MSNQPDTTPDPALDPAPGLAEFYSSQATLMLTQYRNIERLLGPTDDWTAPGSHCEILLRDFLRAYLPSNYQADKGFIYGRRPIGEDTKHCPEIDILVHDNHRFRPILQVDDFVIVQAKAAHAAIQVKRRMDTTQLQKAVTNVVEARDHYYQMSQSLARHTFASAVVFFDEKAPRSDGKPSDTYENCIKEQFSDPNKWALAPDFVGSLQHHVFWRDHTRASLRYVGLPAYFNNQNIAVQAFLSSITNHLARTQCNPLFAFPTIPPSELTFIDFPMPVLPSNVDSLPEGGQP